MKQLILGIILIIASLVIMLFNKNIFILNILFIALIVCGAALTGIGSSKLFKKK